jgi:hypothetical protein
MAVSIITEKELRLFSTDKPELNTLVDQIRWSPEQIESAMTTVVDFYNTMPPTPTAYSVESFPFRYLMTIGCWAILLKGAAIGEASNQLEYSAAGIQINDRNKAEIFMNMGNTYWAEFTEAVKNIKLTQSINKAYGTKHSEYNYRSF